MTAAADEEARLSRALEAARRVGQPVLLEAHRALGRFLHAAGRLDEAESTLRGAVQQARASGDSPRLGAALLDLSAVLRDAGRADRALLAATEAAGLLRGVAPDLALRADEAVRRARSVPGGAR